MFIQIIQGRCSRHDDLRARLDEWRERLGETADGWLGGTYGFTDDDMFVGVVRFASKEAAMANSARPEQSAWWAETEKCFDGPVEFHDAEKVMLMIDGPSDGAGFVQLIRGRIDDPSVLEAELDEMSNILHEARPEIVSSTLAIEDDGTFTEVVAFTDERAARDGEMRAMPRTDEMRHLMEDWRRITHDLSYLDLHHPWSAARGASAGR